ncbi:hypothetical protein [Granulicella sp. S190]|uniref:hypothetical protein n=1 Tax=Granulicella sp. S190 TaxID=1747226 RepID=UPI00131CAD96|nr:hypothetical protein [Granulicella sp. S190]
MSELQSPPVKAGPSLDDQPFVPSGTPNQVPSEVFEADANVWYHLAVNYVDKEGKPASSFFYPLAANASTSFWDYMAFNSTSGLKPSKFKVHPAKGGYSEWEIDDGNYLCLKATGWAYRSSEYRIGWAIVNGHLYSNYWRGPVGYRYDGDSIIAPVPRAYYIGMDLPAFTCELVPA